jgi:hypothetical protein
MITNGCQQSKGSSFTFDDLAGWIRSTTVIPPTPAATRMNLSQLDLTRDADSSVGTIR